MCTTWIILLYERSIIRVFNHVVYVGSRTLHYEYTSHWIVQDVKVNEKFRQFMTIIFAKIPLLINVMR